MRRLGLSLVLLSAALLLLPSGPQAQVVVDPDSPAGKEYAIPLEEKRDQANGNQDAEPGDGQASTFGEGISDPSKDDDKASADGKDSKKKKASKKDSASDSTEYDSTGTVGGGGSGGGGGGPDEAGTSGALLTSGIALAVLLLGGGVAFLMRRGAFGTDA